MKIYLRSFLVLLIIASISLNTRSLFAREENSPPKWTGATKKTTSKFSHHVTELHAVGIYEGYTKTEHRVHEPLAKVHIDRPDKKVNLMLGSYRPVNWHVTVSKRTKLESIFLFGSGRTDSSIIVNHSHPIAV